MAFVALLKDCTQKKDLYRGMRAHASILKKGLLERSPYVGNTLVSMYAKCGMITKAHQVLENLPFRDVVSWSALISGYTHLGQCEEAMKAYEEMQSDGFSSDSVTYTSLLKACGSIPAIKKGRLIHSEIVNKGLLESNKHVVLSNALVDMYAKLGVLIEAKHVLCEMATRNVATWNALITGYIRLGQDEGAINCFECMKNEGTAPNSITFTCILKACGRMRKLCMGEEVHDEIMARRLLKDDDVRLGNALIDMYARCGCLVKARKALYDLGLTRNKVSWNALISGYSQQCRAEEALDCLESMRQDGILPDEITFTCILKACGSMGAFDKGKEIHDEIDKQGLLEKDAVLGTALVDMYARCGALPKAYEVLQKLPNRNIISWNALISGYAQGGQGIEVMTCFKQMLCEGLTPNIVTFSCLLNACSHSGLVDEGETCFVNMSQSHGMFLDLEHYTCMVDIFGRAGHLDKAVMAIKEMPCSDYPPVWAALLGACRKWGYVNLGRFAFKNASQLHSNNDARLQGSRSR